MAGCGLWLTPTIRLNKEDPLKVIIFTAFVVAALLLYCLFWYSDPRNVESFPIDPTGKYYNPY